MSRSFDRTIQFKDTESDPDVLPQPRGGLAGLFGRPTWLEARLPFEWLELLRDPIWHGRELPNGGGRPVLLVPGFLGTQASLAPLRDWLRRREFEAEVAPVGLNAGPARAGAAVVVDCLHRMKAGSQRRVVVIGHSRGGQHGRVAAVRAPDAVAMLVVLGTPLRLAVPRHVSLRVPVGLFQAADRLVGGEEVQAAEAAYERDLLGPFPPEIPLISIWSKSDGIVDWRTSLTRGAQNIAIDGSHLGLCVNRAVYRALASILGASSGAQP